MPSYVVTGASRGLGFQFVKTLGSDSANTVFALARNLATLRSKLEEAGITNVHALQGDVSDAASMTRAASAISSLNNNTIDVIINNAAFVDSGSGFLTVADFAGNPTALTDEMTACFNANVLGVIHTAAAFMPLLLAPSASTPPTPKKFLNLSTGIADLEMTNIYALSHATPYCSTKAAANLVVAKYAAAYGPQGVLFFSISPGYVWTEQNAEAAAKDGEKAMAIGAKFASYAPHFTAPSSPEESVTAVLKVLGEKSVEKGDGGAFVSHLGNQQWL